MIRKMKIVACENNMYGFMAISLTKYVLHSMLFLFIYVAYNDYHNHLVFIKLGSGGGRMWHKLLSKSIKQYSSFIRAFQRLAQRTFQKRFI